MFGGLTLNPNTFFVIPLGITFYYVGKSLERNTKARYHKSIFALVALFGIPQLLIIWYYIPFLRIDNLDWYINLRSSLLFEFSGSLLGLSLGFISNIKASIKYLGRIKNMFLKILILLLLIPYGKNLFLPVQTDNMKNILFDGITLQTTNSTCGPASLSTIFSYYQKHISEKDIAKGAYTTLSGTEIWNIIRFANSHGLKTKISNEKDISKIHIPSILGVKSGNIGHFITLLGRDGEKYIIGEPVVGKETLTQKEFFSRYSFENFSVYFYQ